MESPITPTQADQGEKIGRERAVGSESILILPERTPARISVVELERKLEETAREVRERVQQNLAVVRQQVHKRTANETRA